MIWTLRRSDCGLCSVLCVTEVPGEAGPCLCFWSERCRSTRLQHMEYNQHLLLNPDRLSARCQVIVCSSGGVWLRSVSFEFMFLEKPSCVRSPALSPCFSASTCTTQGALGSSRLNSSFESLPVWRHFQIHLFFTVSNELSSVFCFFLFIWFVDRKEIKIIR